MRKSGVLLPISSLPGKYGIGSFSKESYEFVDFLVEGKQKLWQILPLGPTGYGDSPYQSFSTFAGNPYFISLEELVEEGLLLQEECDEFEFGCDETKVDYEKIYNSRRALLQKAYERSGIREDAEFIKFVAENAFWLDDYALFMALKDEFGGNSWTSWDEDIKTRKADALDKYREALKKRIESYCFQQYCFQKQWLKLKNYANEKGIEIIGDIPIYVSLDSSDAWANPELFQLDEYCNPKAVAGCPPDAFSATGQLWGNPLYTWEYHKETGYEWWVKRIGYCFQLYDIVRIDHFRGFDEYYSILYGEETAMNGHWEKGPGLSLFTTLKEKLGERQIIAEDLGFLTDSVIQLVKDTGYPGMKILQFGFDSREESEYLPHSYIKNSVVYTGTHDIDTTAHWFEVLDEQDKDMAIKYMNLKDDSMACSEMIRMAYASVSDLCIIPMQDFLELGEEARLNMPSTLGSNWTWRMKKDACTDSLAERMSDLVKIYKRV